MTVAGRPRDWHPVADSDPIPGDPDRVAALGRQLRKTAEELDRQIRNLKAVVDVDAWDNKSGKEFREKAKGNVKKLEAAFKRYDTAATAIGSEVVEVGGGYQDKLHAGSRNYASDLNRAQEIADAALKDAQDAEGARGRPRGVWTDCPTRARRRKTPTRTVRTSRTGATPRAAGSTRRARRSTRPGRSGTTRPNGPASPSTTSSATTP
uniref:WXG100 family type VII secretion target n=1 Tax=Streptomyces sp. NBC_01393 TaxID=2903851 RepID=A0AAU3I3R2_9ACTN